LRIAGKLDQNKIARRFEDIGLDGANGKVELCFLEVLLLYFSEQAELRPFIF